MSDHGSHLVVRTPAVPTYHWGNYILVVDHGAIDQAARWSAVFTTEFPEAAHRAVGMVGRPDAETWAGAGFEIEPGTVRVGHGEPVRRPLPAGYTSRTIETTADLAASQALRLREDPGQAEFQTAISAVRWEMINAGSTAWFGAWDQRGELAAELGIVDLGAGMARYQSVLTHPDHRGRGLAGHLLGAAGTWARSRGIQKRVIIADAGTAADRLYESLGFTFAEDAWQAAGLPAEPADPAV